MNWPVISGCFCFARTKLDIYYCIRTHFRLLFQLYVWLKLLVSLSFAANYNLVPRAFSNFSQGSRYEIEQITSRIFTFCLESTFCSVFVASLCFLYNFVRERRASEAGRRNLWCLSGPAESLSHWYPSTRGSTYDWYNSINFAYRSERDPHSCEVTSAVTNKAQKKFWGSNAMTSAIPVRCSTDWAMKCEFDLYPLYEENYMKCQESMR